MAKQKSTARLTYDVERSLQARARAVARERGILHGDYQPSHQREKKSVPKPKEIPENSGQPPGDDGTEAELDIVAEIEGTRTRRPPVPRGEIQGSRGGAAPVRNPGESRISYMSRYKRWRRNQ